MRLTAELIQQSPTFINAIKDRELDLRGNRIPTIENLGASKDLNDTIDLSNNDLKCLDNLPVLKRLKCLLVNNNRVQGFDAELARSLPNLETLVLTGNAVDKLSALEPLRELNRLEYLSLLDNPVTKNQHYRLWVIWRFPLVRVLDFQRVKLKERQQASKLFSTPTGELTSLAKSILEEDSKTFEPGEALAQKYTKSGQHSPKTLGSFDPHQSSVPALAAKAQRDEELRGKIAASTAALANVQHLERLMDGGHIAGGLAHQESSPRSVDQDHPMEDDAKETT
ncbi:U2 snRNP complex subunit [Dispira parvispora]|uniref:U2 small nuclear ribonucleoprotein A' n=1 Tax=Dispira parvispora TaxID=1520584 RepID=A0A9W8AVT2_9FUNG|nr:U2 snRNP complex subunit [Dispira parvispora]